MNDAIQSFVSAERSSGRPALVSRRDCAGAGSRRDDRLRRAAQNFYRNLRRAKLTPTQRWLAEGIAADSLDVGRRQAVYGSLLEILFEPGAAVSIAPPGIGVKEVSRALKGSGGDSLFERGLVDLGIVRVEDVDCSGVKKLLLTLCLDWRHWRCEWWNSIERRQARLDALESQWRAAQAYLPPLAPEPDLTDAMDDTAAESECVSPVGRVIQNPRRPECVSPASMDAPDVSGEHARAPVGSGRWENFPTENRMKCGGFGKVPNAHSLRVKELKSSKAIQQLNSTGCDDSGRLLELLKNQFERAHGKKWAETTMANWGGSIRTVARIWPEEFEIQVGELRNFIDCGGKFKSSAWIYFQWYFSRSVGQQNFKSAHLKAKNQRNLFNNQ